MGYHSQVIIALSKDVIAKDVVTSCIPKWLKEEATLERVDDVYYFEFEDIKWYAGYPEIDAVDSFLESLAPEDYGFIRIGEDSRDIDERGNPHDFELYPSCYIERPY